MVYDPTTTITLKFIDLLHKLIVSYVKSVIEFVGINGLEQSVTVESSSHQGLWSAEFHV